MNTEFIMPLCWPIYFYVYNIFISFYLAAFSNTSCFRSCLSDIPLLASQRSINLNFSLHRRRQRQIVRTLSQFTHIVSFVTVWLSDRDYDEWFVPLHFSHDPCSSRINRATRQSLTYYPWPNFATLRPCNHSRQLSRLSTWHLYFVIIYYLTLHNITQQHQQLTTEYGDYCTQLIILCPHHDQHRLFDVLFLRTTRPGPAHRPI